MKSVSREEARKACLAAFQKPMKKIGITESYLAKKLKAELCAKETKPFKAKVNRPFDPQDLTKGFVDVEEVIYSKPLTAWEVRQKARMDAHKLRGDYPPEKKELGGFDGEPIEFIVKYQKKGNGAGEDV